MLKKQILPTSNSAKVVLIIIDCAKKRRYAASMAIKIANGESVARLHLATINNQ